MKPLIRGKDGRYLKGFDPPWRHHFKEGQKFNKLTILKRKGHNIKREILWECICDCGNHTILTACRIMKNRVKSCGCLKKEIGKLFRKKKGEVAFNNLYGRYRAKAKKKNLNFEFSKDGFKYITSQNCHYCGQRPNQKSQQPTWRGEYVYNGIDRVDNKKGYTKNNSVPCCGQCNKAKSTLSKKDFLSLIKKIYRNHGMKPSKITST